MEGRKVFNCIYTYMLGVIIFLAWLFSFMQKNELINTSIDLENAGFIIIGIIAFIVTAFFRDSFYIGPLLVLVPFSFSRSFDIVTIPYSLYGLIACAILGIIVHLILYHEPIKKGTYFSSLLFLVGGMIFGGAFCGFDKFIPSLLASFALGVVIMIAYIYVVTYLNHHDFYDITRIVVSLGIVLIAQTFAYQILLHKGEMFIYKDANYGWGCTNNLAVMLLFCIPIMVGYIINSKSKNAIIAALLTSTSSICIVLNYSRGAILALAIELPIALLYAFVKSKTKIYFTLYFVTILLMILSIYVALNAYKPLLIDAMYDNIFRVNLETLNGRKEIYENLLLLSREKPLFGYGLLGSMNLSLYSGSENTFGWAHNSFIQMLYCFGITGLITFVIHLFKKYYILLKKGNNKTVMIALALFGSGLYGLMDITYLYVNYMVVMIVIMALIEYEIKEE